MQKWKDWTKTSCDDFVEGFAMVEILTFAAGDFEFAGTEAELPQDRGVDVGDIVTILNGVETDFGV